MNFKNIFKIFLVKKKKPRIAVIVGTRPNFIKMAPFIREAKNHPRFDFTIIHTKQHFDDNMSGVFFDELGIPSPDITFTPGGERHTEKIALMFDKMKDVFKQNKFDAAVVFGDVNSTLAGALAAVKHNCRLIHIEAGLRSHDRRMPEEINRVIVDHLSHLHFVTEQSGVDNLKREGVKDKKIHLVGNIMIESIEIFKDKIESSGVLQELNLKPQGYILATIHRQENTDSPEAVKNIFNLLDDLAQTYPVIIPLHPGTKNKIQEYGLEKLLDNLIVVGPMGYFDFLKLAKESLGVVTDSGGIQEETSHLGVPCCTLRDNTERPITCELGSNKLFSINQTTSSELINHLEKRDFKSKNIPLWDDQVSHRIFEVLESWDI